MAFRCSECLEILVNILCIRSKWSQYLGKVALIQMFIPSEHSDDTLEFAMSYTVEKKTNQSMKPYVLVPSERLHSMVQIQIQNAKMLYSRKFIPKSEVKICLWGQWAVKKDEHNQKLQRFFPVIFIINTVSEAKTIEKGEEKKIPAARSFWKLIRDFQFCCAFPPTFLST